jgi:hypothetical protein
MLSDAVAQITKSKNMNESLKRAFGYRIVICEKTGQVKEAPSITERRTLTLRTAE